MRVLTDQLAAVITPRAAHYFQALDKVSSSGQVAVHGISYFMR